MTVYMYIQANLFGIRFLAMSVISVNKCSGNVCFIKNLINFQHLLYRFHGHRICPKSRPFEYNYFQIPRFLIGN